MSIIIGADIVPVQSNIEMFEKAQLDHLIGRELCDILKGADYRIFNLETPLTEQQNPIRKHGPNLIASTASVSGLKELGIDLFTLANNHILDQDVQGLKSTIHVLDHAGIAHVGAGKNIQESSEPAFFTVKGKRYGVYACAEHEFSIAEENKPGANPFDPLDSLDHVNQVKAQCDYVIVLYHGGKEFFRYPSPHLQKVCRKLIEKGADLVVCQHSHCIGCEEKYQDGTIVYGQGNFLFDDEDNEYCNTSLLISIDETGLIAYIPLVKKANGVRLAEKEDAEKILDSFETRSEEIKEGGFIEEKYIAFARKNNDIYMTYFSGKRGRFLFRALNKLSGQKLQSTVAKHYRKKMGLAVRNYIECEAHRELIIKGLE